jgi:hypothetical protein
MELPGSDRQTDRISSYCYDKGSRESSSDLAMRYGLDGWGSIVGKGKIFLFTASRTALGSTRPSIQWVPWALCPRVKRQGREADHV